MTVDQYREIEKDFKALKSLETSLETQMALVGDSNQPISHLIDNLF